MAAEPQAVTTLIRICARLPLALRIATARAASRPHLAIADVVAEMEVDRARLDALSPCGDDPTSVRAVFDWSYHRLDAGQARLAALMPRAQYAEVPGAYVLSMLDEPETVARRMSGFLTSTT